MKRIVAKILSGVMTIGLLTGCANTEEITKVETQIETAGDTELAASEVATEKKPLKIVTTIFPEYDWTREILGEQLEHTELTLLLDNGVDLHSFQPTADDMIAIGSADLFIYVGGESDAWVEDVLANATNKDMIALNLLEILGDDVKVEEVVEGMQDHDHDHDEDCDDDEHDHDHDEDYDDHEHEHEHGELEYDEHVWLSLDYAEEICEAIARALSTLDESNADLYRANCDAYVEKLEVLDDAYETVVANGQLDTVLFADRFPFRYLVDEYDLEYYAAFVGCSAETEASFETIAFLAGKVDELGLEHIIVLEGSDEKIANTVMASTNTKNQTIIQMNAMQSVTSQNLAAGATYLSIMEQNLEVLKEVLQ